MHVNLYVDYHENKAVQEKLSRNLVNHLRDHHERFFKIKLPGKPDILMDEYVKVHLLLTPVLLIDVLFLVWPKDVSGEHWPKTIWHPQVDCAYKAIFEIFQNHIVPSDMMKLEFPFAEAAINLLIHIQSLFCNKISSYCSRIKEILDPLPRIRNENKLKLSDSSADKYKNLFLKVSGQAQISYHNVMTERAQAANAAGRLPSEVLSRADVRGKAHEEVVNLGELANYFWLLEKACYCLSLHYGLTPSNRVQADNRTRAERFTTASTTAIDAYHQAYQNGRELSWMADKAINIGSTRRR